MTDTPDLRKDEPCDLARNLGRGRPVEDWTTDYDIRDKDYVENPVPIWAEMREKCRSHTPIASVGMEPDSLRRCGRWRR